MTLESQNQGKLFFAVAAAIFLLPGICAAADVPGRDSAGVEAERLEEESLAVRQATYQAILPQVELTEEEEGLKSLPEGQVSFELKAVKITGNQSIPSTELEGNVSTYIGKQISFGDLQKIVSKIKQYYRSRGFVAVYVYLPPQEIEGGVVEFRVVEGKIGSVEIQGNHWFSASVIRRRLQLTPKKVVSYEGLKSALSRLNRHRDIKVRAALKPGK